MPVELLAPRVKVPVLPMPTYVKLAEAFGVGAGASLFDKSRYRSHGAITGAAWAAGVHGYCLDFNAAVPDYVEIPAAHTQLNFTSEDFSGIARINLETLTDNETIIVRGLLATDGWWFFVLDTGNLAVYTMRPVGAGGTLSAAGDIGAGTWYTVGFSRNGASVKLYRNGVDVTVAPGVHADLLPSARTAKIAVYDDLATSPLDGKIEFLRIFGGIALAASEHLAWHNALV